MVRRALLPGFSSLGTRNSGGRGVLVGAVLVAAAVYGCSSSGAGVECVESTECEDGLRCLVGECVPDKTWWGLSGGVVNIPDGPGPGPDPGPRTDGGPAPAPDLKATYHSMNIMGSASTVVPRSLAVSEAGALYVAGSVTVADFGGGQQMSAGGWDAFVARYDDAGAYLGSANYGAAENDHAFGIALDRQGLAYVVGQFGGSLDLGGTALTAVGKQDVFAGAFTADGAHEWSWSWNDATLAVENDAVRAVTVDHRENAYLVGDYAQAGGQRAAVWIFGRDTRTGPLWRADLTGGEAEGFVSTAHGVAVDSNVQSYVVASFNNTASPMTVRSVTEAGVSSAMLGPSVGEQDIALIAFDADGLHRWSKTFGGEGSDVPRAILVDGDGNLYMAGEFHGAVDFGGGPLTSGAEGDLFLASYDSEGAHRWSKQFSSDLGSRGSALALGPDDHLYLAGAFAGSGTTLGGESVQSAGEQDVYVASLTTTGQSRWDESYGGAQRDVSIAIAAGPAGAVYVAGLFEGQADFGGSGGPVTGPGETSSFLLKLISD